jgi:hypothetical protein
MNHTIYLLAGIILSIGILAFWLFSGLGFLFLLVFLGSKGSVLDLYRFTRIGQRPVEPVLRRPNQAIPKLPGDTPLDSPAPVEQAIDPEDDLAIHLAETIG